MKNKFFLTALFAIITIASKAQWQQVGSCDGMIQCFATSGNKVFGGSTVGLFVSANNGVSWTEVNTGLTNKEITSLAVSGAAIFAGTKGGVFFSANNGTTWNEVNTGLTNTVIQAFAVKGTSIFTATKGGVFLL